MLTKEQARAAVQAEIDQMLAKYHRPPGHFVIMDEFTRERPWGWVFFYNSRRFSETRNKMHSLAGNAPYLVNRNSGEIRVTGTARPIEEYIREYESTLAEGS